MVGGITTVSYTHLDVYKRQPIYMILMVVFFTCWSLFAAMLSSMSRDFKNLVQAFVTPIFWLSGIMYDVSSIDVTWIQKAMLFNPVNYFASGYRNTFIYETWIWDCLLYTSRCV